MQFLQSFILDIVDKISEQIVRALKEIGFEGVEIVEELNPKIVYKIG
jgi:hypothetical protein